MVKIKQAKLSSEVSACELLDNHLYLQDNMVKHGISDNVICNKGTIQCLQVYSKCIILPSDINLKNLKNAEGDIIDTDGLKIVTIKLNGFIDNANDITVKIGDDNGYNFLGNDWKFDIKPSCFIHCFSSNQAPKISDINKIITLNGTNGDKLNIIILFC